LNNIHGLTATRKYENGDFQVKILLAKIPRNLVSDFVESHEALALGYLCSSLQEDGFISEILDTSLTNLSVV